MVDQKLPDALSVELALKNHFHSKYGNKFIDVEFRKVWYQGGSERDLWETEGDVILKRFLWLKKRRSIRYQLDPLSGDVIGYQDVRSN